MSEVTDYLNAQANYVKAQQDATFGGIDRLQNIQQKYYDNKKLSQLLPFVAPKEQALTEQEQIKSQFAPQMNQADINSKNALAQYQYQQAMKTRGETANLSWDEWNKMYQSSPDWAKAQMLIDRENAMRANPALAGTSAPGYGQGQPQSAFAPQPATNYDNNQNTSQVTSAFTPSDIQAARSVTPAAANAGMGNGQPGQRDLVPASMVPMPTDFQTTGETSYGNQQPAQSKADYDAATTLFSNTGAAADQAKLASDLAVGDAGQRANFSEKVGPYKNFKTINQIILNNPGMFEKYAGPDGIAQYNYDSAQAQNPLNPDRDNPPSELLAMQQLQNTFARITPDQLSKMFTNTGTKSNIQNASAALNAAFRPGATLSQALNGQVELKNLMAGDMAYQAKLGGKASEDEFERLTGAKVDRDFSKNPLVPDMTPEQLHRFLSGKSPADRKRYAQGVREMIERLSQEQGAE